MLIAICLVPFGILGVLMIKVVRQRQSSDEQHKRQMEEYYAGIQRPMRVIETAVRYLAWGMQFVWLAATCTGPVFALYVTSRENEPWSVRLILALVVFVICALGFSGTRRVWLQGARTVEKEREEERKQAEAAASSSPEKKPASAPE